MVETFREQSETTPAPRALRKVSPSRGGGACGGSWPKPSRRGGAFRALRAQSALNPRRENLEIWWFNPMQVLLPMGDALRRPRGVPACLDPVFLVVRILTTRIGHTHAARVLCVTWGAQTACVAACRTRRMASTACTTSRAQRGRAGGLSLSSVSGRDRGNSHHP